MAIWPATLPQSPMGMANVELQDSRIRSQVDQGPPLVRRRFTAAVRNVEFPMYLSGTELAIFDEFYETTLAHGSLRFQWTDPRTDALVQYRFVEPPKWASLRGGDPADRLWMAAFKLEIIPGEFEPIIPSVENLAATLTGSASLVAGAVRVKSIAATLLGGSSLSADGTTTVVHDVAATLQGASSLAAQAYAVRSAAATLIGQGTLTATPQDSSDIPAVIYDGVQGYMLHTGGPAGAADGAALSFAWAGTFNSDGSAMTLLDIPGTVPVKLTRNADNTIDFVGGTAGAVFSNSTAAVAASVGFCIVLASCNGTTSHLYVIHAAGLITGTNTAGSATNLDLTANWFLGADGGAAEFLDADTALWWIDDAFIDFSDSDNREEFWDTTNDLLRDPGATGTNPTGSQPLVCHKSPAATHTANAGSGGDADTAGTFSDGTSPGTYAADFSAARTAADVLGESVAWWAADNASNTHDGSTFSALADLSGNGNTLAQATAGNQPTRTDTSGVISIEYDAVDDVMVCASPTAGLMNNFSTGGTYIAVFRADSAGESSVGRLWDKGTELALFNNPTLMRHDFDHATTDGAVRTDNSIGTSIAVVTARYSKAVGTAGFTINVNGASASFNVIAASSGAASDLSGNDFHLGNNAATSRTFNGGIYELAFWNTSLSDTDVDLVEAFLATKYSITLS